jgi:putative transposase
MREAVRATRAERPFGIDAWVVLPDHLHCVWTLPEGDADFSTRWGAIKARFSRKVREAGISRAGCSPPSPAPPRVWTGRNGGVNPAIRVAKGEAGIWQRRFWEHHIRDAEDYRAAARSRAAISWPG